MLDPKTQESIDWLNRAHQRTVCDAITDGVMVQLFYAAQGDITQFRIKGRKIIEDAGASIPLQSPEDVMTERMASPTPSNLDRIRWAFAEFRKDACVPGDDRVSEAFIKAGLTLLGAQANVPTTTAEFWEWFKREWAVYQDKSFTNKVEAGAWALKTWKYYSANATAQSADAERAIDNLKFIAKTLDASGDFNTSTRIMNAVDALLAATGAKP
jgi:hypothetical protein